MKTLNNYVAAYKTQLELGDIQIAYNELVKFVMNIRTDLMKSLAPQYSFANILHGYMDFTYFYYSNSFLKNKKLKLGFVLNHLEMRFEIWLLGNTIPIQKEYWNLLKSAKWNKNRTEMPKYSVLEAIILSNPDFDDLDLLSKDIQETLTLVTDEIIDLLKSSECSNS